MTPRELGALYPQVDAGKCIDCQLCRRICAYQTQKTSENMPLLAYAAVAKDRKLLDRSASGGVFATLAGAILNADGAVFGCSMEQENGTLIPKHICVESKEDLYKLQGSKYVQSDLGDTFKQVKQLLKQGRTVLFSGTPCQVDALKKYIEGKQSQNLYTVDLICHGVPGAKLFQDYLAQLSKDRVTEFRFRDKTLGWGYTIKYCVTDDRGNQRRKTLPRELSSYSTYFLASETCRQSCYTCRYANLNRIGDVTIGDFWGIEEEHPDFLAENGGSFSVREGISAILVNTEKGVRLLEEYGQKLHLKESYSEAVAKWNRQLTGPGKHTDLRKEIVEQYEKNGYTSVEKLFRSRLGVQLYVRKLKHFIKKCLRGLR